MLRRYFIVLFCALCASAAEDVSTTTIAPVCSDAEWRCTDGGCIRKEGRCNTVVDCRDASDEYLDTCDGVVRPIFALQMLCFSHSGRTKKICPQICYDQPEFCFYALMGENGQPNTCRFPKYPENGKYAVQPLVDRPVNEGFRLEYTCDESHALVQSRRLECVNGTWVNGDENRYCAVSCELPKNENFTYTCDGKPCSDRVPVDAVVTAMRKVKQDPPVSITITCQRNKTFSSTNITTDCVTEIDNLQINFENPTMQKMTEYESKFNQFKANETSIEFHNLVQEFQGFERTVREKLDEMHKQSEECDMFLDLLLYNLQKEIF